MKAEGPNTSFEHRCAWPYGDSDVGGTEGKEFGWIVDIERNGEYMCQNLGSMF